VSHLTAASSDHGPIVLQWGENLDHLRKRKRKKVFKYELMWESHEDFFPMLAQMWQDEGKASKMEELLSKLTTVSRRLGEWESDTFGNVRKELRHLNA